MGCNSQILNVSRILIAVPILFIAATFITAGQTAILTPDGTETSKRFADVLAVSLENRIPILDRGLASAVFQAQSLANPYNLSNNEARIVGAGIGCSYFILLKADTVRRTSFKRRKYFESFAAVYLADARSGDLIEWHLNKAEADSAILALEMMLKNATESAARIETKIRSRTTNRSANSIAASDDAPSREGIRPPLPYRRIKPKYTESADLYGIEATVDIEVEIDRSGKVTDTRVTRWAGFGLDESVEKTVREMNWRPADNRDGTFTMRVMLRYNFRDIDNDDN